MYAACVLLVDTLLADTLRSFMDTHFHTFTLTLTQAPMPESRSALSEDRRGFWVALLEVAGFGLVQNVAELNHYVRCTLLVHTCATEQVCVCFGGVYKHAFTLETRHT